jgi:hypothetical protein
MKGKEQFTCQTTWMVERLLAWVKDNQVYQGGLLLDVTYKFFENGHLLTTSMFCEQVCRWIPIHYSWIRGLAETYYHKHFWILFNQLLIPSLSKTKRKTLAQQVVDFSLAQKNGYVSAYMEVFQEADKKQSDQESPRVS